MLCPLHVGDYGLASPLRLVVVFHKSYHMRRDHLAVFLRPFVLSKGLFPLSVSEVGLVWADTYMNATLVEVDAFDLFSPNTCLLDLIPFIML